MTRWYSWHGDDEVGIMMSYGPHMLSTPMLSTSHCEKG